MRLTGTPDSSRKNFRTTRHLTINQQEVLTAVFASIEKANREAAAAAAAEGEKEKEKAVAVSLSGLLLKLLPCVPGADSPSSSAPPSDERIAALTLDVLRECVPGEVPGIVLLSGGLSERRATETLSAINLEKLKREKGSSSSSSSPSLYPWAISFSFGRALQASAMRLWSSGKKKGGGAGEEERASIAAARAAVEASSRANREASLGIYKGPHPMAKTETDLREGFRGFRDDAVAREAAEAAAAKKSEAVAV